MTGPSLDALVEQALTDAPDHTDDGLRGAAINLAFDHKLVPEQLSSLLAALESRTGTRLERRTSIRAPLMTRSTSRR